MAVHKLRNIIKGKEVGKSITPGHRVRAKRRYSREGGTKIPTIASCNM